MNFWTQRTKYAVLARARHRRERQNIPNDAETSAQVPTARDSQLMYSHKSQEMQGVYIQDVAEKVEAETGVGVEADGAGEAEVICSYLPNVVFQSWPCPNSTWSSNFEPHIRLQI